MINETIWNELPGWARTALREAAEEIPADHNDLTTENNLPIEDAFEAAGVEISDFSAADIATVRAAAAVVQANWVCGFPAARRSSAALALQALKAFIAMLEAEAALDALRQAGSLSSHQAGWLGDKLEAAVDKLERSRDDQAIDRLESFVQRLDRLVADGGLAAADAVPLYDRAAAAIAALESIPAVAASCP